MSPYLLLLAGLLLIFLEFYLPGGVMGTAGALVIISSIVVVSLQSESLIEIFLFVLGSLVGTIAVVKFALWHIRRTRHTRSIFLESDQEGYRASSFDKKMIGRKGTAIADMRPGGYVLIEGKKYQALSLSGFIPKGSLVEVVTGQGESLHVKQMKKESS